MINHKAYPKYKDSGVEWLGEIPEHWEVTPGFSILSERRDKNLGMKRNTVLSLSYGRVIVKPKEKLTGLVPESFETYQLVDKGNIIIRPTDLQNDHTSLRTGLAKNSGIITSAYLNLQVGHAQDTRFWHYYLHTIDTNKVIYGLGSGLRQNIDYRDFKRFPFLSIPSKEQVAIASFLDEKVGKIDEAIAQKEQLIQLLGERKQIIIQNAVTKGLNPNAPMKDSGIEWIGEIPEHWEVEFNRNLFKERKEPGRENLPLLSVSIHSGVSEQELNEDENIRGKIKIQDKSNYKLVNRGDIAYNMMRAWQGGIGNVTNTGMVSPAYVVAQPKGAINSAYFELQYRIPLFIQEMNRASKGITDFRKRLYWDEFKALHTIVPPESEQFSILKHIETQSTKITQAISQAEQSIKTLKEYKATLINSAVTGKIKVPS